MSNLYTWGYNYTLPEEQPEHHTIFAVANSEGEAREIVKRDFGKSLNWPTIEQALQQQPAIHSNGDCSIAVTGASILP